MERSPRCTVKRGEGKSKYRTVCTGALLSYEKGEKGNTELYLLVSAQRNTGKIYKKLQKIMAGEIKVDRESAGITFHYSWCAVAIVELVNYVNIL